jgi:DnaA family protein
MKQMSLGVQLKERATFASFLTARNVELVAHLRTVAAETPAGATWLTGPHTAGKSHLLQAVCAGVRTGARTAYLPLETLLPFGPGALDGAEALDVACFDDVQTIAGLDDWERRLFSLWQRAQERGTSMLFTARESPTQVAYGLADLKSRLASSTVFAVRELNDDEQVEALGLRAHLRGFELPTETARFLQHRFPRDMRTLCEVLDTLDDAAFVAQRRITIPFIRNVIDRKP